MRIYMVMAVGLALGLSACNTQDAITENQQLPPKPELTMADVVPVTQPATPEAKAKQEKFLQENIPLLRSRELAINSYYLQEYGNAWGYLHKSLRRNRAIADKAFISALLEKQQDPRGKYTPQLGQ